MPPECQHLGGKFTNMSQESDAFAEVCFSALKDAQICNHKLTPAEAKAVISECYAKSTKGKRAAFTPPTPQEVTAYSIGIGWPLDGHEWCLGYEKKGWKISGSARMTSWKSAIEYWKRAEIKTKKTPYAAPLKPAIGAPAGWKEWVAEEMPTCPYAPGEDCHHYEWGQVPEDHRKAILTQMKAQGKA